MMSITLTLTFKDVIKVAAALQWVTDDLRPFQSLTDEAVVYQNLHDEILRQAVDGTWTSTLEESVDS